MKIKIQIFALITSLGFILPNSPVTFAAATDLDPLLRENFSDMIDQLCHSSLTYNMGQPFLENKERYQKTMNCLFNDAMQRSVNEMNADFRPILKSIIRYASNRQLEDVSFDASFCVGLENIQTKQRSKQYETTCDAPDNPTVMKPYAACRVSETALNELCAYEEYLEWKMLDYQSFRNEFDEEMGSNQFKSMEMWEREKNQHKKELILVKKTLDEMLYRYQKWEQNYRMHMWFVAIIEGLKQTRDLLTELRKAIDVFPTKFNNATSEIPDQQCN